MTPVFCCGAECGQSGIHFTASGAGATIDTITKRSGARSFRANSSGAAATWTYTISGSIFVGRVAVYFTSLPNTDSSIIGGLGAGFSQSVAFKSADSKLYAYNSGFGATGVTVTTGKWYVIDFRFKSSPNPSTCDVTIDGTSCAQASSATTGSFTSFLIGYGGAGNNADAYYDDIVLSQTDADYPIGDGFVNHFVPTSDGSHNIAGTGDFKRGAAGVDILNATTDSYLLVDDVPMDDTTPDVDDYINAIAPPNATDYTENKFGPASGISTPTTGPRAVEVVTANHQFGTGTGVSATKLNDNGTEDTVMSLSGAGVTSTRYYRKHYATMVGGGAWTVVRFNNLRVRFGYSSDANPDQYFDCAMIEAEFAPVATTGVSIAWMGA